MREAHLESSLQMTASQLAYSPVKAAKVLGIGRSTIFNLLARGEITASKLGTRTLISTEELQRYLASLPKAEFHAHTGPRV
jgi:excisionase family DNA binding protein